MRVGHHLLFAGVMLTIVAANGCSTGTLGLFARSKPDVSGDYWGSVEEHLVIDDPAETANEQVRQVSATAVAPSAQPALLTLARGDDLEARIANVKGTVLLDFYADWCGPCRKQGKILHEIQSTVAANEAMVVKIDVEQHKALAKKYQVKSLPTLVVLKDGKVANRKIGLTRKQDLIAWVQ